MLYGTRTSTFILVKESGEVSFFEKDVASEPARLERRFDWNISGDL